MPLITPAVPTLGSVTADVENARLSFAVTADENVGSDGVQHLQVQVSTNGVDWRDLTNFELVEGFSAQAHDYEAATGERHYFRARSVQVDDSGSGLPSAWSPTVSGTALYAEWWLKCPALPSLNIPLFVTSGFNYMPRQLRREITYPMSREDPITDNGVHMLGKLTVPVRAGTTIEMRQIADLAETNEKLLLQDDLGAQWYCEATEMPSFGRAESSPTYTATLNLVEVKAP